MAGRTSKLTAQAAPARWSVYVLCLCLAAAAGAAAGAEPENLLRNPGFEAGSEGPEGWRPFVPRLRPQAAASGPTQIDGLSFSWDSSHRHSGRRAVRIDARDARAGMWQQIAAVVPGRFYRLTGWVKLQDVRGLRSACCFQLVFRGADGQIVQFVHLPMHRGTTDWMHDLPHPMLLRAPQESAKVEVNLFARGTGTAWFDDVSFGPAPVGTIFGTITSQGKPLPGAEVVLWGTDFAARTDARGRYELAGVPAASPRYILIARKRGYNTRPAGDIAARGGQATRIDLELPPGDDRFNVDLRVKFGSLRRCEPARPNGVPEDAVIDPRRYPQHVRVYLRPSEHIDSDHPSVQRAAREILAGVPAKERTSTRSVAWAVYQWIIRNVEFDTTYDTQGPHPGTNYTDVTSGKWQTVCGKGWCWGHNFTDWLYKPSEALRERRGICIEHSRLATALLRALGIPARPVKPYQAQLWVQRPSGQGSWSAICTNGGRAAYRDRGDTEAGFARLSPAAVHLFPLDAGPIIHSDWHTDNKCLWREVHPWHAVYSATQAGLRQALADMAAFARTGQDPRRRHGPRRQRPDRPAPQRPGPRRPAGGPREAPERLEPPPSPREDRYVVAYSDFTLNLSNIGRQRRIRARFPLPLSSPHVTYDAKHAVFWTNHPERVRRTWVSEETAALGGARREWFNIELDLSPLFAGATAAPARPAGGE